MIDTPYSQGLSAGISGYKSKNPYKYDTADYNEWENCFQNGFSQWLLLQVC